MKKISSTTRTSSAESIARKADRGEEYEPEQLFAVDVILYMDRGKRHDIHDVDNRLKDILDALQGRFRGSSGKKLRLIKNDNKICKAKPYRTSHKCAF